MISQQPNEHESGDGGGDPAAGSAAEEEVNIGRPGQNAEDINAAKAATLRNKITNPRAGTNAGAPSIRKFR